MLGVFMTLGFLATDIAFVGPQELEHLDTRDSVIGVPVVAIRKRLRHF